MGQARASRHGHRVTVSDTVAYKASGHGNPRTRLSRLGPLESLILEYAVEVAESFTPSDIVVYAKKRYGLKIDRRRVYDALQRLVRRGALVKVRRGWYKLADSVDLPRGDLKLKKHRESLLDNVGRGRGDPKDSRLRALGAVLGVGVVGCGVVRVHGVAGGLLEYYFQVAYSYYVLSVLLRDLEGYLRGLGYSRRLLCWVRGSARLLALSAVSGCECVVGGHGRYGSRGRELKPLSLYERLYEVGVDFLVHGELPKIHLKVYTARSPYVEPRATPLVAWARS